jgi:putative transposase
MFGWLRYRNSRRVLSEVRNVTVSHSAGKWLVSTQTVWQRGRRHRGLR